MSLVQQLAALQKQQNSVVEALKADAKTIDALNKVGMNVADLKKLHNLTRNRFESSLYDSAIRELEMSVLSAVSGSYRQAMAGLRLFLELWLSGIGFSANELNFRKWKLGKRDIVWRRIVNKNKGVFSSNFLEVFIESHEQRQKLLSLAVLTYRQCSEYVHGNATTHDMLPRKISFQPTILLDWSQKAQSLQLIAVCMFVYRYFNDLNISERESISSIILENAGDLPEFRKLFGVTTGG